MKRPTQTHTHTKPHTHTHTHTHTQYTYIAIIRAKRIGIYLYFFFGNRYIPRYMFALNAIIGAKRIGIYLQRLGYTYIHIAIRAKIDKAVETPLWPSGASHAFVFTTTCICLHHLGPRTQLSLLKDTIVSTRGHHCLYDHLQYLDYLGPRQEYRKFKALDTLVCLF